MCCASVVFAEHVWADVCCLGLHQLCRFGSALWICTCCYTGISVFPLLAVNRDWSLSIAARTPCVHTSVYVLKGMTACMPPGSKPMHCLLCQVSVTGDCLKVVWYQHSEGVSLLDTQHRRCAPTPTWATTPHQGTVAVFTAFCAPNTTSTQVHSNQHSVRIQEET